MIDINFLTPEYKFKLMFKNMGKFMILFLLIILGVLLSANIYLKEMLREKNIEITGINAKIKKINEQTKSVKAKMKEIPDLTNSIQIVEDIFSQENLRISEILFTMQEEIPSKVYLYSLTYDGENIRFNGKAEINSKEKRNSYENVFQFERNLKDSGKFVNIEADYIRMTGSGKNETSEFAYDMQLKMN